MRFAQKFCLIGGIIFYSVLSSNIVRAQIIPDGTTPNTNITGDCLIRCDINGGIKADSNLFHSFQEFNVDFGENVYFVAPEVENIFSRVTGGNISEVLGNLGVTGNANLWLLNPNGIIFGRGATLDINGSFVATTADRIEFGDRGFFAASGDTTENLPLLTVNPSAFFYHQMGQGNPITVAQGALLTVPTQENVVLLGAQQTETREGVSISGGIIQAPQGRVEIGAVGETAPIGINSDFQLQFPEAITKGNITLSQNGAIDVSGIGGGSIAIQGREISIIDGSNINSATLGNVDGGSIAIAAQQLNIDGGVISSFSFGGGKGADILVTAKSIELVGGGIENYQELVSQALTGELTPGNTTSSIVTASGSLGAAGNITMDSSNISVIDGGFIASATYNQGDGGSIDVTASETIELSSSGLLSLSAANSFGDTGNLNINTGKLTVREGSIVSAATLGKGAGGDILIQASESIELLETPDNFILPTAIFTNSVFEGAGDAGNLTIDTQRLVIKDGAQISSASGLLTNDILISSGGAGGNIDIRASESLTVSGNSADGRFPSIILSDTRSNNPAGNINIDAGTLSLEDQAFISASSSNTGNGGNLTINTSESVQLVGSGTKQLQELILQLFSQQVDFGNISSGLFTTTVQGNAGTLTINTPHLTLAEGAVISTATFAQGQGGDLEINAFEEVNIIGSAIASSTLGNGNAGKVTVNTGRFTTDDGGLLATSTIGGGNAGDLTLNATDYVKLLENQVIPIVIGGISTGSFAGLAQPGNLTINTQKLIIRSGAQVDALNTVFPQLATVNGSSDVSKDVSNASEKTNVTINATESILIEGTSLNDNFPSGITSTTTTNAPASDINITTGQLSIADSAHISVNSLGNGDAGNLTITANSLYLDNGGNLNANTLSGKGGNIVLEIGNFLQLEDGAAITTNAFNQGDGGNIEIETEFLVVFPNSQITGTAIAGDGGNITIVANDLFVSPNSEINASSELGIDGEINIKTFTSDLRNILVKLPEKLLNAENEIVSRCGGNNNSAESNFVYVGKGGLPPSPLENNNYSDRFLADLGTIENPTNSTTVSLQTINQQKSPVIVEATGWSIGDRGQVILTAERSPNNTKFTTEDTVSCPFRERSF